MAKITGHGDEIGRWLIEGGQRVAMSDGVILQRGFFDRKWKVCARKKAEVPLAEFVERRRAWLDAQPEWRKVKGIPSQRQLEEWSVDGVCETPAGERVEPDGKGPSGAPSWLLLAGLI